MALLITQVVFKSSPKALAKPHFPISTKAYMELGRVSVTHLSCKYCQIKNWFSKGMCHSDDSIGRRKWVCMWRGGDEFKWWLVS